VLVALGGNCRLILLRDGDIEQHARAASTEQGKMWLGKPALVELLEPPLRSPAWVGSWMSRGRVCTLLEARPAVLPSRRSTR